MDMNNFLIKSKIYMFYDLLFSKFSEERIFSEKSRVLVSLLIIIIPKIDVKVFIYEKYTC